MKIAGRNNHDPMSPLARKLRVELVGKRAEYDPADPFEPEPFDDRRCLELPPYRGGFLTVNASSTPRVKSGSAN